MLNDTFNQLLILSMYDKLTNTGQIHNVLTGRTTPSILFLVEINQWHHLYGVFPKLSRNSVEKLHRLYLDNHYIENADKKFHLTQKSKNYLKNNFSQFKEGSATFYTAEILEDFWSLIRFVSQVISEKKYNNKQYIPHRDDLTSQLFVKYLLKENEEIENKWFKEQYQIFEWMSEDESLLLANSLTGHQQNGLTLDQIARIQKVTVGKIYFNKLNAINNFVNNIFKSKNLVLHHKVIEEILSRHDYGLTSSAYQTLKLLSENFSIKEIARIKYVKVSTIKEHILEIAFKLPEVELTYLVPDEAKKILSNYFNKTENRHFKDMAEQISDLEFYQYRLIEIEWIRKVNKNER